MRPASLLDEDELDGQSSSCSSGTDGSTEEFEEEKVELGQDHLYFSEREAGYSCCGRHVPWCCCGCLIALLSIGAVWVTILVAQSIGRFVAERAIQQAEVSFTSIDVGPVDTSRALRPRIRGTIKLAIPSPCDALVHPMQITLRAGVATRGGGRGLLQREEGFVYLGRALVPALRVDTSRGIVPLDLQVRFEVDSADALGLAGKHFVASRQTFWIIEASFNVTAWLFGFVPFYMHGVGLNKRITLEGLAGFSQAVNPVSLEDMTYAHGEPGRLYVTARVRLHNPSYIAARIPSALRFNVAQRGQPFGEVSVGNLHFQPGPNVFPVNFTLFDNVGNDEAIRAFILGYMRAEEVQPLMVFGSALSTTDHLLRAIMDGLNLTFNFRPPQTQFIQRIEADIGLQIRAKATVFNPLPQTITLGDLNLVVKEDNLTGSQVFRIDTTKSASYSRGSDLLPNQSSTLEIALSLLDANLNDLSLVNRLIHAARMGRLVVGVVGPVGFTIKPGFQATVDYSSENVTAELRCPLFCAKGS